MKTVSQYRQNAEDCRGMARKVTAPEHRQGLLKMAETWDKLAEERMKTAPLSPADPTDR